MGVLKELPRALPWQRLRSAARADCWAIRKATSELHCEDRIKSDVVMVTKDYTNHIEKAVSLFVRLLSSSLPSLIKILQYVFPHARRNVFHCGLYFDGDVGLFIPPRFVIALFLPPSFSYC